jgi:hypothetical protein
MSCKRRTTPLSGFLPDSLLGGRRLQSPYGTSGIITDRRQMSHFVPVCTYTVDRKRGGRKKQHVLSQVVVQLLVSKAAAPDLRNRLLDG